MTTNRFVTGPQGWATMMEKKESESIRTKEEGAKPDNTTRHTGTIARKHPAISGNQPDGEGAAASKSDDAHGHSDAELFASRGAAQRTEARTDEGCRHIAHKETTLRNRRTSHSEPQRESNQR